MTSPVSIKKKKLARYQHYECDKAVLSGDYKKIRKNACVGCGGKRKATK